VDLADLSATQVMNATGQSGHVGNGHYSDMIGPWARVEYHPVFWSDEDLKKAGYQRLVIRPR
jgi:penicillin G amidase